MWKRRSVLLALVGAVGFLWLSGEPVREEPVRQSTVARDKAQGGTGHETDRAKPGRGKATRVERLVPPTGTPAEVPDDMPITITGERFDFGQFHGWNPGARFRTEVAWTVIDELHGNVPELQRKAAAGDGEAAYMIYAFLNACRSAPRTHEEAAVRAERHAERRRKNPDLAKRSLRGPAVFEACTGLDQRGLGHLEYEWLVRSAKLGYAAGIHDFLWIGHGLAVTLAMQGQAGYVETYRARVTELMDRYLHADPEHALWLAFEMERQGILGPVDLVEAAAYLRAVELIAIEDADERLDRWTDWFGRKLEAPQLRTARERGRELCRRYVPRECGG